MRLLLALVSVLLTLMSAAGAFACKQSLIDRSHIVGFDEHGSFVEYYRRVDYATEDEQDPEHFTLYDKNGVEQSRLSLVRDKTGRSRWERRGAYFGNVADGLGKDDAKRIEAAIAKAKKLSNTTKARKIRHVKSEMECGSIELSSRDGWLRIADGDLLGGDGCVGFSISAFEHEKTNLVFVRLKIEYGHVNDSLHSADIVEWIGKERVEGVALALRGERARLKGNLEEAIAALKGSLKKNPEYLPSRLSLVRAWAKAGRDAAPLLSLLRKPIPGANSLIGSPPDHALVTALFKKSWPDAKLPESFPWHEDRGRTFTLAGAFY